MQQRHSCFFWRPARFPPVAWHAGTDHILPGMFAAPFPRHNVVYGKFAQVNPAILAGKLVPVEDFKFGHPALPVGALYEINKPYN